MLTRFVVLPQYVRIGKNGGGTMSKDRGFWCKNFHILASNLLNLDILILVF